MRTLFGMIVLALAVALLVWELVALMDPTRGLVIPASESIYIRISPWYVHGVWLAAVAALGWTSMRLLNRGIVGRLVRGRGFTPADR